jgi:hypothetical protein
MPTSLSPLLSSMPSSHPTAASPNPSLTFQPNIPPTPPPQPTIPVIIAYQLFSPSCSNDSYQNNTTYSPYPNYSQPILPYFQTTNPYNYQPQNHSTMFWPRQYPNWPDQTPILHHPTPKTKTTVLLNPLAEA